MVLQYSLHMLYDTLSNKSNDSFGFNLKIKRILDALFFNHLYEMLSMIMMMMIV